ncbi:MAG: hypothetical protein ABIR47_11330 [Candidatus Kapaibacterium sp.]
MTSLSEVDFHAVEEQLTPARVRVFQFVQVALGVGIMMFLVVILFFYGMGSEMVEHQTGAADMMASMTIVTGILSLIGLILGEVIYRASFSEKRLRRYASAPLRDRGRVVDDPAEKIIMIVQKAGILRATIFNVAAFFGLTICIIGMTGGILFLRPDYFVNAIPAFLQLLLLAITFPTRDRVLRIIREKIIMAR